MIQSTKRINLISGPRNISTALMYSFANRPDTQVVDEPMYAYYLNNTSIKYHPSTKEILESLPHDIEEVKEKLIFQDIDRDVYFIKGMAHHYVDLDLSFLLELENILLIRDPLELISSFSRVIENPSMDDIGLKREWEICEYLIANKKTPVVLDSNNVLNNPRIELKKLCLKLKIPFVEEMLQWKKGPIPQDGVWAKHWYYNVWNSTGFKKQETHYKKLPKSLIKLYNDSDQYYKMLKSYC